mmetsp:Transcript_56619/g.112590  ORF Transcript_56619/g.112590 Transcript_56619/m.112590 type:complete len:173 (-) Transcript_56619:972-1490(-)
MSILSARLGSCRSSTAEILDGASNGECMRGETIPDSEAVPVLCALINRGDDKGDDRSKSCKDSLRVSSLRTAGALTELVQHSVHMAAEGSMKMYITNPKPQAIPTIEDTELKRLLRAAGRMRHNADTIYRFPGNSNAPDNADSRICSLKQRTFKGTVTKREQPNNARASIAA